MPTPMGGVGRAAVRDAHNANGRFPGKTHEACVWENVCSLPPSEDSLKASPGPEP